MDNPQQNQTLPHSQTPDWAKDALAETPPPFTATVKESILAFAIYLPAYLYLRSSWGDVLFYLFCAIFVAMVEWRYWQQPHSTESWIWLGCFCVIALSEPLHRNRIWDDHRMLFLHAFAIYWTLHRSGRLLDGKSSTLLPLDAFYGVVIFPFKHFFLRIRTVFYTLTHLRVEGKKRSASAILIVVLALGLALWLLLAALGELSDADETFSKAVSEIMTALTPNWDPFTIELLLVSLPVGAYLYGLIVGTGREAVESVRARGMTVRTRILLLRKVPNALWVGISAIFSMVYLAFLVLQASYHFGAFSQTIPEGFTIAGYARQGFFSLCRVMAVNFVLLWLVSRTGVRCTQSSLITRLICTVLLVESLLFAVLAASKLVFYITSYGFTPLRLQSAWLIAVLAAGCVASLYTLWSGRKSFALWTIFSGASLALMHLY